MSALEIIHNIHFYDLEKDLFCQRDYPNIWPHSKNALNGASCPLRLTTQNLFDYTCELELKRKTWFETKFQLVLKLKRLKMMKYCFLNF
jgi:hypothetical protein